MTISENGLAMIRHWEGCELDAYQDGGGVWTIGVGHTGADVYAGLTWSQAQADATLASDALEVAQDPVCELVAVPLTQNQFDALCSFTFNLGSGNLSTSTLLRTLNAGDYPGAQAQFPRWNQIAGKPSQGLTNRRNAEANLFGTPDGDPAAAAAASVNTAGDPPVAHAPPPKTAPAPQTAPAAEETKHAARPKSDR